MTVDVLVRPTRCEGRIMQQHTSDKFTHNAYTLLSFFMPQIKAISVHFAVMTYPHITFQCSLCRHDIATHHILGKTMMNLSAYFAGYSGHNDPFSS